MSRPGAWSQVWKNLLKSVGAYEKHVAKKYVGEDRFGNRYYELPERASNVRRGYDAGRDAPLPSVEWDSWLKGTRRHPPSEEEIMMNVRRQEAQRLQDLATEHRAPKIESKGKGAADVDRPTIYPTYKDMGPGLEGRKTHSDSTEQRKK